MDNDTKQIPWDKFSKPVTIEHLEGNERLAMINKEFKDGFDYIHSYEKSVTFFGSARFKSDDKYYQKAEKVAYRISKELGYVIVTGGGPGIMEAANKGAYDAGGQSLGFTIKLPHEQSDNKYLTGKLGFDFFFSRKTMMWFAAEAYVFFPGGFGTFDELFEVLTLVQTGKIEKVPIILVGEEYWKPLSNLIKEDMLIHHYTIDAKDTDLYTVTDDEDKILEIIKNAPVRN